MMAVQRRGTVALTVVRAIAGTYALVLVAGLMWVTVSGIGELTRLAFYTGVPNVSGPGSGAGPQIFNTFYVLALTMLFTVPLGLGAGIYFAEYAGTGRWANIARRATETLATLPSIVVGLFGYALLVGTAGIRPSRLTAALALVVITLPYAVRVTEDALRSLPSTLRDSSKALGATRAQTIWRTQIPAALPQLVTGIILVAGRVFAEAAVLLFTASILGTLTTAPHPSFSPLANGDTLAVDLYAFRGQIESAAVTDANQYANGIAALLVIVVLTFNVGARLLGARLTKRVHGV